ncbi:MAG: recombination protein RecR [Cytophagales bacterium]|nr:recombination protein RecR [Cytophagales bacterium]MCA6369632.1 recombination protein RecR [Cytophagales bacterium]MCA6372478.1 recombination protein RecR [Cytophagales bacterium]MCA6378031.1 recombination protein RecR [Cytophagales bacterium]MCA6385700.1 recombination protein RecR [Cytophagales bacterium]
MDFPSKLIEDAVNEVAKLPGIGKKTALRMVLHLIKENEHRTAALTEALNKLRSNIRFCKTCHNISDEEECTICKSHKRDKSIICVVEDTQDVMAIENTAQFLGVYHVLGGVISPMNGIGPSDIKIDSLISRLTTGNEIKEIILALSPTMEGDTTNFYINRRLAAFSVKITSIARGIPVGGDLEYADEITLGRSILGRTLFS